MKKYLWTPLAVAVIAAIVFAARYDESYGKSTFVYDVMCAQPRQPASAPTSLACKVYPEQNDQQGRSETLWWRKLIAWPEGITAWLLLLTLGAISWQSWEARKAAQAALLNAQFLIDSERAWLVASPSTPDPPIPKVYAHAASMAPMATTVLVRFMNKGQSPAFIKRIATGGCAIPRGELPKLNDTPDYDEVGAIPIVPDDYFGWQHSRIEIEKAIKLRTGELSLWIYGAITYDDSFGRERETGFCFRFQPAPSGEIGGGEWMISGPKGANHAT